MMTTATAAIMYTSVDGPVCGFGAGEGEAEGEVEDETDGEGEAVAPVVGVGVAVAGVGVGFTAGEAEEAGPTDIAVSADELQ